MDAGLIEDLLYHSPATNIATTTANLLVVPEVPVDVVLHLQVAVNSDSEVNTLANQCLKYLNFGLSLMAGLLTVILLDLIEDLDANLARVLAELCQLHHHLQLLGDKDRVALVNRLVELVEVGENGLIDPVQLQYREQVTHQLHLELVEIVQLLLEHLIVILLAKAVLQENECPCNDLRLHIVVTNEQLWQVDRKIRC